MIIFEVLIFFNSILKINRKMLRKGKPVFVRYSMCEERVNVVAASEN